MKTIKTYITPDGRDLYATFFKRLRDPIAKAKIASRINRLGSEHYGDHKFCREGVWELRIDQGPGYRVYYCLVAGEVLLLLLAGDKSTQSTDIEEATHCLYDYLTR